MRNLRLSQAFLALATAAVPAFAQPVVHPDGSVTFAFKAPNAQRVGVTWEGAAARLPMVRDASGVWEATTEPLAPDFYGYNFFVDGVAELDPLNPHLKPNLLNPGSEVHVPGPATLSWEEGAVPHGVVHHHFYRSGVVGDQRDFFVYTPPGYDPASGQRYPALYLLHGMSDDASAWTAVGRANVILDNLIAWGKARPMIVVMPLGYGAPELVAPGPKKTLADLPTRQKNYRRFREALLKEVIPQVEGAYRIQPDREDRAIAGLSMGGSESLYVGLNELDTFAWIGAFSSGSLAQVNPTLDASSAARIRLLWIACGRDDPRLAQSQDFEKWLTDKGIRYTAVETPGAHAWQVWRRNLTAFAPLLFRTTAP